MDRGEGGKEGKNGERGRRERRRERRREERPLLSYLFLHRRERSNTALKTSEFLFCYETSLCAKTIVDNKTTSRWSTEDT